MERRMDQPSHGRAVARESVQHLRRIQQHLRRIHLEIEETCDKTRSVIASSHVVMHAVDEQISRESELIGSKK
jgi:hypothetical protein